MARNFSDVIFETLQQMGPGALEDAGRFSSGVQDMGQGFDAEKKFMTRTFDQKFLDICSEAGRSEPAEIGAVQLRAKEYLKREYMLSEEWAGSMAAAFISGIERYAFPDRRQQFGRPQAGPEMPGTADPSRTVALNDPVSGTDTVELPGKTGFSRGAGTAGIAGGAAGRMAAGQRPAFAAAAGGVEGYQRQQNAGTAQDPARQGGGAGKRFLLIVILAAIIFGGGIGALIYTLAGGSDDAAVTDVGSESAPAAASAEVVLQPEDVLVLNHDINYSQIIKQSDAHYRYMTYDRDGVDTLIRVENRGEKALRCFDFKIRAEEDAYFANAEGGDTFRAYGLVEPGQSGNMYARIRVPAGTSGQGDIEVASIVADGPVPGCPDYRLPSGYVLEQSEDDDAYVVSITNDTDYEAHAGAYVIAVGGDGTELGGSWGGDTLPEALAAGASKVYDNMIYNPGWDQRDHDLDWYKVTVLDPAYLEVQ